MFSVDQAPPTNKFNSGFSLIPHETKKDKGGEDAATVMPNFLAAIDGVGGWAQSGIDPAIYAR